MQKTEIIKFLECPAAEKRRRQRARRSWTAVESQLIGATKKFHFPIDELKRILQCSP